MGITLLPRKTGEMPAEMAVTGGGSPPGLVALQEDWYQDVALPVEGDILREGLRWIGKLAKNREVQWVLSGREVYVLGRHDHLNGFVSVPRLGLGEEHVVLCAADRSQDVRAAVAMTGSPEPAAMGVENGVPAGWVCMRGIVPRTALAPLREGDILDILRPLAEVSIAFEGGIRIDRQTWLDGHPPKIRLRGDVGLIESVQIDGVESTLNPDGSRTAPSWDSVGDHSVWCTSESKSYVIRGGREDWGPWEAYRWSQGDVASDGAPTRPAICGVVVLPPASARQGSKAIVVPASNQVLLGAVPGEIVVCTTRSDVRTGVCVGYPWFRPVWAVPMDALRCEKRTSRVLLVGGLKSVESNSRHSAPSPGATAPGRVVRTSERVREWCLAILNSGRKGLPVEPAVAETAQAWSEYRTLARSLLRRTR